MAYACDAEKLAPGDIVLVEKPLGPSGQPTYPHFFVVMSVPRPLKAGDRIPCIGITSRTAEEAFNAEEHFKLPWMNRRGGHPSTGLDRPSIAKVIFRHTLIVEAGHTFPLEVPAQSRGKFIKAADLQAITARVHAHSRKLMLQAKNLESNKKQSR